MKRKQPTARETLAAAILQLFEIPHEHAKLMTTDQIISLINRDHYPVAWNIGRDLGWSAEELNHPSNIVLRLIPAHRVKSADVDTPEAAKTDRISEQHAAFQQRMLAKTTPEAQPEPAGKPKAKIRSRGFQKAPEGHKWFKTKRQQRL